MCRPSPRYVVADRVRLSAILENLILTRQSRIPAGHRGVRLGHISEAVDSLERQRIGIQHTSSRRCGSSSCQVASRPTFAGSGHRLALVRDLGPSSRRHRVEAQATLGQRQHVHRPSCRARCAWTCRQDATPRRRLTRQARPSAGSDPLRRRQSSYACETRQWMLELLGQHTRPRTKARAR